MVRARLWPSSPQRPQFAFSFEFLNWAEALLLEAQVSLNDFCKAIAFKCKHPLTKVSVIFFLLNISSTTVLVVLGTKLLCHNDRLF